MDGCLSSWLISRITIGWLADWLARWVISRLTWTPNRLVASLTDLLVGCWLVKKLTGCSIKWLADYFADRLLEWLYGALSPVRYSLFGIFSATLHIWRPSPPTAPCSTDKGPHKHNRYSAVAICVRICPWRPRIIQDKFSNTYMFLVSFVIRIISNFAHKARLY
jgi:hypothetical protein